MDSEEMQERIMTLTQQVERLKKENAALQAERSDAQAEVKALSAPRRCERCSGRCRPVSAVVMEQELALTAMRHSDSEPRKGHAETLLRQTFQELHGLCEACAQAKQ